jgi:hypothetical protein
VDQEGVCAGIDGPVAGKSFDMLVIDDPLRECKAPWCCKQLIQGPTEKNKQFKKRIYCDRYCASAHSQELLQLKRLRKKRALMLGGST